MKTYKVTHRNGNTRSYKVTGDRGPLAAFAAMVAKYKSQGKVWSPPEPGNTCLFQQGNIRYIVVRNKDVLEVKVAADLFGFL